MPGRLTWLFLLLIPQLIGWFWLSNNMPYMDHFWSYWAQDKLQVVIEHQAYRVDRAWFESVLFDLDAETWRVQDRYAARNAIAPQKPAQYWRVREPERGTSVTAELVNRQTNEVLKQRPLPSMCELVDQRYAVYESGNYLFWLDLQDDQSTFQKLTGLPNTGWVYWHCWSGSTVVVQRDVFDQTNKSLTSWIDLVRFDDGQARVLVSWPVYRTPGFYHYLDADDTVATWDTAGTTLEFRSKQDGQLVAAEVMPPGLSAASIEWGLPGKLVHINSPEGWRNYDLRRRQWINVPNGTRITNRVLDQATGAEFGQLIDQNRKRYLYDIKHQKRLDIQSPDLIGNSSWQFHDANTAVLFDQSLLAAFHVYQLRDEGLVKTFAPFRYVPYYLAALWLGFLAWSVCWMRESARRGGWAWLDVLLVVGVPTAFCLYRHLSTGCVWDMRRLTTAYMLGGSLALLVLSGLWIVFGTTRWTLRCIPLLVAQAGALLIIRLTTAGQVDLHVGQLTFLDSTLLATVIGLVCVRCAGVQLRQLDSATTRVAECDSPRLSDFFLLTGVVALAMLAAGSAFRLSDVKLIQLDWQNTLTASLALLLALMFSLSRYRVPFGLGMILFFVCLIMVIIEPFTRMLSQFRLEKSLFHLVDDRTTLVAAVATYAAVLPYRLRGYRFVGRNKR